MKCAPSAIFRALKISQHVEERLQQVQAQHFQQAKVFQLLPDQGTAQSGCLGRQPSDSQHLKVRLALCRSQLGLFQPGLQVHIQVCFQFIHQPLKYELKKKSFTITPKCQGYFQFRNSFR